MPSAGDNETTQLCALIPPCARRVLCVGGGRWTEHARRRAAERVVWCVEPDPEARGEAAAHLDGLGADFQSLPEEPFDCVLVATNAFPLQHAAAQLAPQGFLYTAGALAAWAANQLEDCGLIQYGLPPGLTGQLAPAPLAATHHGYDPMEHAAALAATGHPDWGFGLLENLPPGYPADPHARADAAAAVQRGFLAQAQARAHDPNLVLALFFRAQKAFFHAIYIDPHHQNAYLFQARFWRLIGRPDMAVRLLENLSASGTNPQRQALLDACRAEAAPEPAAEPAPPPPTFSLPSTPPRVLMLLVPGYDPGADILYDGLCTVLGEHNVQEYPYKPLLHGQDAEKADGYPTTFNHPGNALGLDELCAELARGAFDFIVYADMLQTIPQADLARILSAAPGTPVYVVDGWDDASNNLPLAVRHMGGRAPGAYFKRELIAGVRYEADLPVIPLPLSYPDNRLPARLPHRRRTAVFWAGNRYYGQRRLYLAHLEAMLAASFDQHYRPEDYRAALLDAHMGLSLLGFGFDTVRYWEIPAHGALLLAERPPIHIPYNFVDGESALFFDTVAQLAERLAAFLHHPHQIPRIAARGHAHLRQYHTGSARARQFLGHIDRLTRAAAPSAR